MEIGRRPVSNDLFPAAEGTGRQTGMKLTIERNSGANREKVPYMIALEILSVTADVGRVYRIPVAITYVGAGKHFHVEICGVRLDAQGKPQALLQSAEILCRNLINVSRFPSYVFIARRAGHVYPAYTIGDEVFITTTGGGPVFRHVELARVRRHLTEYLHQIKVLGQDGKSDKLHVRGIDPRTLGLRRPVLYLKKRVVGEEDFWAPAFISGDGRALYTYAASERRETPLDGGCEVLRLREIVARALQADRRLGDRYDLRPDRLMPAGWQALRERLNPAGRVMIGGRDFDFFNIALDGEQPLWLGLEPRPGEDRFGLFVGASAEDTLARMTRDFARRQAKLEEDF